MAPYLSKQQVVGVALTVLAACKKERRKRKMWMKPIYLKKPELSHIRLMDVLDAEDLRNFLRMTPAVFTDLLNMVRPHIEKQNTVMREAVSAQERLIVTLRFLATGRSYNDLKYSAAISPSLLSTVIPETCAAIYNCLKQYIRVNMPANEEQWKKVATTFEEKWNFPHCLGALDGKHVRINKPPGSASVYFNYKKFFSVIMFALVDANYRFMYVKTGINGSVNDSTVFESTKLYEKLMTGKLKLPGDCPLPGTESEAPYVFLGDSAFALNKHFMKPYTLKNITHDRRIFNYRLSRARRVTENAFGILASRFRILRTCIAVNLENLDQIILACCALHNYLSTFNPLYQQYNVTVDQEDTVNCTFQPGEWRLNGELVPLCQSNSKQRYEEGINIRNKFVHYFTNEGSVPFQEAMLTVIPQVL